MPLYCTANVQWPAADGGIFEKIQESQAMKGLAEFVKTM
jgi:hypothetical protein